MSSKLGASLVVLALTALAHAQTTWYVDDDAPGDPGPGDPSISDPLEDGSADHPFDAIQEGIDAAIDGDTVLVLDGTYTGTDNKDLDFGGSAITVRSASGDPGTCVIDCEGSGRGFCFQSAETAEAVVEGFTITNGLVGDSGGGIMCGDDAGPSISHCTITANWASACGGGVYCGLGSYATISDCVITGNVARIPYPFVGGGGVFCGDPYSACTLLRCVISGNTALDGAGVNCGANSSGAFT